MNKQHILAEIARTAAANGSGALGKERFFQDAALVLAALEKSLAP